MQILPTTVKTQSVWLLAIGVLVAIMFMQGFGWYDFNTLLGKSTTSAATS